MKKVINNNTKAVMTGLELPKNIKSTIKEILVVYAGTINSNTENALIIKSRFSKKILVKRKRVDVRLAKTLNVLVSPHTDYPTKVIEKLTKETATNFEIQIIGLK